MANIDDNTLERLITKISNLTDSISENNRRNNDNINTENRNNVAGLRNFREARRNERQADDARRHARNARSMNDISAARRYEGLAESKERRSKAQKNAGITVAAKTLTSGINGIINIAYTTVLAGIHKREARLKAANELQIRAIKTYGSALNKAAAIQAKQIGGKAIDNAYASLNAMMEGGKSMYMKNVADAITYSQLNLDLMKANFEVGKSITGALSSIGGAVSTLGPVGAIAGGFLSILGNIGNKEMERRAAEAEYEIKLAEAVEKAQDEYLNQAQEMGKTYSEMSKNVSNSFLELTNETYKFGRGLFLTSDNVEKYSQSVASAMVNLAKINMDQKDFMQMQNTYASVSGRNVLLNETDAMGLGILSRYTGMSTDETSNLVASMNIFNTSVSDSNEMIYEMSKNTTKMGLNATKYAKSLQQSLKLSEKYQFKGGVRGVMEMAKWAQNVRFNMEELSGALSAIRTGNIEDTLTASARLNVLGGNAAIYSDPMSMMYNAYANPRAYAENINKMIKGFGKFNNKTGETEFNINESMRIEAIAKALGVSSEGLFNQARQANKRSAIQRQFAGKGFGDNVINAATWDEKKGWVVRAGAGKGETLALNEINANDARLKDIFPEDKQERIIDIIADIDNKLGAWGMLSPEEQQEAGQKYGTAAVLVKDYGDMVSTMNTITEMQFQTVNENLDSFATAIKTTNEYLIKAQTLSNEIVSGGAGLNAYKEFLKWSHGQFEDLTKSMDTEGTAMWFLKHGTIKEGLKFLLENAKNLTGPKESFTVDELKELGKEKWESLYAQQMELNSITNGRQYEKMLSGELKYENYQYLERQKDGGYKPLPFGRYDTEEGQELIARHHPEVLREYLYNTMPGDRHKHQRQLNIDKYEKKYPFFKYNADDLYVSPKHGIYKLNPEDSALFTKPGGSFDRSSRNNGGRFEHVHSGSITLNCGNQSVDLIQLLRENPNVLRDLAREVTSESVRKTYGGKSNSGVIGR